jgi:hypothetical protein
LLSVCALIGLTLGCARESAAAAALYRRFKLSIGYHYSSGTYGTSDTTEISYVPLTAAAEISRFTLQLTIPYLRISGPAGFIQGPTGVIQTTGGVSDGLGDIIARGAYLLWPWKPWMPFIDVAGLIKFHTASRSKGLGTGEFDFGFEPEFWWSVGKFAPFAKVGYRYFGSPPDMNLHGVAVASVGGTYRVLETLSAGLLLDYRQAPSSDIGTRLELIPYASWKVDAHWSVDPYVSAGLADGSPAVGVGVQTGYAW